MKKLTAADSETKSADLVAENLARLKALLPELVTEGTLVKLCRRSTFRSGDTSSF